MRLPFRLYASMCVHMGAACLLMSCWKVWISCEKVLWSARNSRKNVFSGTGYTAFTAVACAGASGSVSRSIYEEKASAHTLLVDGCSSAGSGAEAGSAGGANSRAVSSSSGPRSRCAHASASNSDACADAAPLERSLFLARCTARFSASRSTSGCLVSARAFAHSTDSTW